MIISKPIGVVFDPATWRDADAAMVGRSADSPSWRVAAFQRLAMLAWSQRAAAEETWRRAWRDSLGEDAQRHWDAVIAGRQWLLLPADEDDLRVHLGDNVVDECWRAAIAAQPRSDGTLGAAVGSTSSQPGTGVDGPVRLERPRLSNDRGVSEAARRHVRLVAAAAGVDPPRLVRVHIGDRRARVSVSGVPGIFAYVTVPQGARIRAAGIDMPDGTRRTVAYDRVSGGFDRTHWTAT